MGQKAVPRRGKNNNLPPRIAMAPLRSRKACRDLQGVDLVYVGTLGVIARTAPIVVSNACRRAFVSAFAAVRREFDLIPTEIVWIDVIVPPLRLWDGLCGRVISVGLSCGDERRTENL